MIKTRNSTGYMLSQGLFLEIAPSDEHVVFTMKDEDHKGYKSFPSLYREYCKADPTEYNLAMEVFGSWEHWMVLQENSRIKAMVDKLREEVSVYIKMQAMRKLLEDATSESRSATSSAKYLIEQPWVKKSDGRKKVVKETNKAFSQVEADARRLGVIS